MKKLLLSLIICSLFLCSSCSTPDAVTNIQGMYFDTVVTISLYDKEGAKLSPEVEALCQKYDDLLSKTNEESDIYRLNHSGGTPVEVDAETAELLTLASSYATMTDGCFNPALGSVTGLWDFKDKKTVPPSADLEAALEHTDYHDLQIDDQTVTLKDPLMEVDIGGIAKGFIADKLKDYLLSKGVKNALINLGGNVLAIGEKPGGSPFKIGIQNPQEETGEALAVAEIDNESVVTSGTYQRFFEQDGIRYHHLLDPATGYPADNDLESVSIICDSSTMADALSTACFVMGYEKGAAFIESLEDVQGIFITKDLVVHEID
ncbi:thiamine biosynthesis lipoprotein [Lachnospiraceae bacterium PM6-15]|uniref:FAD:protein FMN transferase n=1 Tax=Ohessyouella blattaphilus TaxID=2949333 RepID=UPI003E18631D